MMNLIDTYHSVVVLIAQDMLFVVGLIALIYWFRLDTQNKVKFLIFGIITGLVALLLAKVGGSLFYNARPFVSDNLVALMPHAADNGFPSDHTLLSAAIAVSVYYFSKKLGLVLFGLAIIIGVSRVLAHVHHPIDIIGSLIFAVIGGLVAYWLTPKITAMLGNKQQA